MSTESGVLSFDEVEVELREKPSNVRSVNVMICSWNVGNAPPILEEMKAHWITPGPEIGIVVVGTQECEYKEEGGASTDFPDKVVSALGDDFYLVQANSLLEMRLLVFARNALKPHVGGIQVAKEATGLAHVYGNKGGLVVKLTVYGTDIAFTSTHLAAHEPKLKRRNADISEIVAGTQGSSFDIKHLDIFNQFHHVFFFGDMNYRIALDRPADQIDDDAWTASAWAKVNALIERQEWALLFQHDQLQQEVLSERCLYGFKEAPISFSPTFKVERVPGMAYKQQRVSSWCDRILWKSLPGSDTCVQNTLYNSCPSMSTSDHKPIHATFKITCEPPPPLCPTPMFRLSFSNLCAKNLEVADLQSSDPYLMVYSNPPGLFGQAFLTTPPTTTVVKQNLNPVWGDLAVDLHCTGGQYVYDKCCLFLTIYDKDAGPLNKDDPLGTSILALNICFDPSTGQPAVSPQPFDRPLYLNGRPCLKGGRIQGNVLLHTDFTGKGHTNVKGSCCETCIMQ
jgi:hypothetical protein